MSFELNKITRFVDLKFTFEFRLIRLNCSSVAASNEVVFEGFEGFEGVVTIIGKTSPAKP